MPDPILLLAALLAVALFLALTVCAVVAIMRRTEPVKPRSLPDLIGQPPTFRWEHPVLRGDEVVLGPDEPPRGMDPVTVTDGRVERVTGGAR